MNVEQEIAAWRSYIEKKSHLPAEDIQELEDHLRDEMRDLQECGLSEEEALLLALRRMGDQSMLAHELSAVHSDKLWKQLFSPTQNVPNHREVLWVVVAALLAAVLGKIPLLFGVTLEGGAEIYARNLSLFVVPVMMAAYYLLRRFSQKLLAFLFGLVIAATLAANLYPFVAGGDTSALFALHLPMLLWLALGFAYCGDDWCSIRMPMDFIRFSGELFLYSVLILCGGFVLTMLVMVFFTSIGFEVEVFVRDYVAFSGLLATPVVAAYLVEKKRSLIENMAPVLARIFIPLFLVMMVSFLIAAGFQQQSILANRDMLILVDLLLVLVVGMVLYDLSAREANEAFSLAHGINIALIAAALAIDVLALLGLVGRLGEYGFSPNRTAALGENVLLLANLLVLLYNYARFARRRGSLADILRAQVLYLPVYVLWMLFMVFALPPLFSFA